MAHINLLPWRAARGLQRRREFFIQLIAAALAGFGALLLWGFYMTQRIDNQNDRNAYLQSEVKQLDVRIAKIKDLEKIRGQLLARKQIIEQLQSDRSQMVHLFDELVKTIPSNVRLTALKQSGQQLSLDGVAQSNTSVAEYMRNIETSPWMGHSDLRKTENIHDSSRMPYTFGLDVLLGHPKADASPSGDGLPSSMSSVPAPPLIPITPMPSLAKPATVAPIVVSPAKATSSAPLVAPPVKAALSNKEGGTP